MLKQKQNNCNIYDHQVQRHSTTWQITSQSQQHSECCHQPYETDIQLINFHVVHHSICYLRASSPTVRCGAKQAMAQMRICTPWNSCLPLISHTPCWGTTCALVCTHIHTTLQLACNVLQHTSSVYTHSHKPTPKTYFLILNITNYTPYLHMELRHTASNSSTNNNSMSMSEGT